VALNAVADKKCVTMKKILLFHDEIDVKPLSEWGLCENIHSWISIVGDLAFSHQGGIYGFKFPKRFSGDLFLRSLSFSLFLN
jgi:hypothetical protein